MDMGHSWVATVGYQGTATRHLTRQYNLNVFLLATQGIQLNPVAQHVNLYDNEGQGELQRTAGRCEAQLRPDLPN